jgi:hypothetical protein
MLVRKGTNPTTVTVCIALREAVKEGTARAIFGLPLFVLPDLFKGRLPNIGEFPVPDPRDLEPSGGWRFATEGLEQAAPAFALYQQLGCGNNVFHGD